MLHLNYRLAALPAIVAAALFSFATSAEAASFTVENNSIVVAPAAGSVFAPGNVAGSAKGVLQFRVFDSTKTFNSLFLSNTFAHDGVGDANDQTIALTYNPFGLSQLLTISYNFAKVAPALTPGDYITSLGVFGYLSNGSALETSQVFSSQTNWTVVPTPALLPGLLGLGVAALRRKQDDGIEENA